MKNYPLFVLITGLSLIFLLVFLSQPSTQASLSEFMGLTGSSSQSTKDVSKKTERVIVNRVVDGDTIVLEDGRTVRYLNVDTPESVKPGTPVQCYAKEASTQNKGMVEGKEVIIKADKENTDKYGRSLRFVFSPGKNPDDIEQSVNAFLVRNGYGRALIIKPNNSFEDTFLTLQAQAEKEKVGVWGSCKKPFVE